MWYISNQINKDKILPCAATWMDIVGTQLSEMSLRKTNATDMWNLKTQNK